MSDHTILMIILFLMMAPVLIWIALFIVQWLLVLIIMVGTGVYNTVRRSQGWK